MPNFMLVSLNARFLWKMELICLANATIFMKIGLAVKKIWPFLHLIIVVHEGCHFVSLFT